jgi:NAD(P)-dependent dehydrogenase (short-subunit alcohol dehydrogenase family)
MGQTQFDFADETIVVTGSSSGIGRQIALLLGQANATVIIADIREEPKDENTTVPTHKIIEENGGQAHFVETDVSNPTQLETVVETASEFGGLNAMINNAAMLLEQPFTEVTQEEFDRLFAVNVRGVFFGCQIAANHMIEQDIQGSIINIASISANYAQHDLTAYEATKGAIRMITRGSALELAEHGIRVNGIAPGAIATEFRPGLADDTRQAARNDEFIKPIPLGREGSPEEVAPAAAFLASDQAHYITGEILNVDGGWQIC